MDDFNAKKSRASKMRQDKYRDRPKKPVDSGSKGGKGDSKEVKQDKTFQQTDVSEVQTTKNIALAEENVPSFSKRKLVSNWDRYEEPVHVGRFEEDVDAIGAHFEELLSVPISGGHLKMKHEHEWEKEKSELQMPWFQLNIQGVEQNLSTISFCKRQNLPQNIFSENQLQRMVVRAKRNATSLAEVNASILKVQNLHVGNSVSNQVDIKDKSILKDPSVIDIKRPLHHMEFPEVKESDNLENQDLDDILALHESSSNSSLMTTIKPTVEVPSKEEADSSNIIKEIPTLAPSDTSVDTTNTTQPTVSLDDWLDSILDD